jgi:regulator of protease activity HflC (stomatin/prohibitin superfamily)
MNMKFIVSGIIAVVVIVAALIGFAVCSENIGAGYVGYKYDRTIKNGDERAIEGTSVINEQLTGLVWINPVTQDVLKYPTTIVTRNWTGLAEGDNKEDWSMTVGTQEGKNIDVDIYISVKPRDIGSIIKNFGTKQFDNIVNDDIYGLAKGKLSVITQNYSIYDIQSSRSIIQDETATILSETLLNTYGVELVRFEIGTLSLPQDIQAKIDAKTNAINEVELAKLQREKQDETNQMIVDQQKAESEKELVRKKNEADAAAYAKKSAAEAELVVAENKVKVAEANVEVARLEKEAELEKQKSYTEQYFRDKELDVQRAAVEAINPSVKTIITDGSGEGYAGLVGIKEVLDVVE